MKLTTTGTPLSKDVRCEGGTVLGLIAGADLVLPVSVDTKSIPIRYIFNTQEAKSEECLCRDDATYRAYIVNIGLNRIIELT